MLEEAGCTVDHEKSLVRIPRHLIENVLKWAPSKIALFDRDGRSSLDHGGDNTYSWSGNVGTYVLTSESGGRRPATVEDVGKFARLADALENISVVGVQAVPQDVRGSLGEVVSAHVVFANTSKHVFFCQTDATVATAEFEMARTILAGKELAKYPIMTSLVDPTTPLSWDKGPVEALIENARARVPCIIASCPTSGGTAPISMAGTLVVQNAEILSGVLISQLASRGAPVIYGTASLILDMRQGRAVLGTPETVALRVAVTQLGRSHNLPTQTIAPDSDSHCLDEQNAWEKIMTAAAALNSGANILMNSGMLASGLTVSYEQLVVDNEILGWLFHLRKGIEVTPETLDIEHIAQAGPGGHFLRGDLHFATNRLRTEYWTPGISCRSAYDKWTKNGARNVVRVATEKANEILQRHEPTRLGSDTDRELDRIVEDFKRTVM
jgi:trimethylamine--corrinoid protein Co-methyltransferase